MARQKIKVKKTKKKYRRAKASKRCILCGRYK